MSVEVYVGRQVGIAAHCLRRPPASGELICEELARVTSTSETRTECAYTETVQGMPRGEDRAVVMLVDDEDGVLVSLDALFSVATEYRVLSFNDPWKALEEAKRTPLDLVISDFLMPQMNGPSRRELRGHDRW